MMIKKYYFIGIGMMLYFVVYLIDKFLISIEDIIYIPIVIVSIVLMLIGINKKEN